MDWREQTYPKWMKDNPAHIAMSKSLSTNLNHLFLLRSLEELTGEEHNSSELAVANDNHFWQGTYYSSYKTTELNQATVEKIKTCWELLWLFWISRTHPEAMQQYPQVLWTSCYLSTATAHSHLSQSSSMAICHCLQHLGCTRSKQSTSF